MSQGEMGDSRLSAPPQTNQGHSWGPLAGIAARTIPKVQGSIPVVGLNFNCKKWACLSFRGDPSLGLGLSSWLHTKLLTRIDSRALHGTTIVGANLSGSFQSALMWKTQKVHFLPYAEQNNLVNEYGVCPTGTSAPWTIVPTYFSDHPRSSFVNA